jgi:hypothetical protein
LLVAVNAMVWQAASRAQAAEMAGMSDHSLRAALKRPHVMNHYLHECEVLRLSGRAKRLHRLEELAMQDVNKNAAVNAIKAAEGLGDEADARPGGRTALAPGLVIQIVGDATIKTPAQTINAEPALIEAPFNAPSKPDRAEDRSAADSVFRHPLVPYR